MGFFGIPNRGFLFWARSKNPENPVIPKKSRKSPGDRDRDFKTSKKSWKNPECENPSMKSRSPGNRDRHSKIPKKFRESPEKIPREKSRKSQKWWRPRAKRPGLCKIHEIRDFLPLGYPGDKKGSEFFSFLNNLKQGRCRTESHWVYLYRLVYYGIFDTFGGFC